MFEAEALKRKPVRAGAPSGRVEAPASSPAGPAPGFGADEEEAVMKRLQELGYVE